MRAFSARYLTAEPLGSQAGGAAEASLRLPSPKSGRKYLLYAHIPFCERLCPYCSFNRYPLNEPLAHVYFDCLRREMQMLAQMGYEFHSMYVGGGTPTVLIDELAATIDLAGALFDLREVSC